MKYGMVRCGLPSGTWAGTPTERQTQTTTPATTTRSIKEFLNMNTHYRSFRIHDLKMILAAATLVVLSPSVLAAETAAAAGTVPAAQVVNIADYGIDGDTHFYQVACSDNRKGSVEVKAEPRETCASGRDGEPTCRTNWTVKEAAIDICR